MPTSANLVYWNYCDNLHGKPILVTIQKHDEKIVEITVNYVSSNNIYKKTFILFVIIIISLLSLIFEVFSIKYSIAIFFIISCFIYSIIFAVKQEKILIVQSLGYQTEVHYTLGRTVKFIAWRYIKSCFINEVVSKQRVIFLLSLLTKDTSKEAIIPLFTKTTPRLCSLEIMYQHIDDCHNS